MEIAKEILRCMSLPETLVEFVDDRPGHEFRYSLNCGKIHRLGWKPLMSLDAGLQNTIEWYGVNTRWWRPLVD